MPTKTTTQRLTESGEEALQKLLQNPGTAKVLGAANSLKERVDELTKRVGGLAAIEKRLADLERRVEDLSPRRKPKPKAAAKPASRTPSKPAAKKPAARPKKP